MTSLSLLTNFNGFYFNAILLPLKCINNQSCTLSMENRVASTQAEIKTASNAEQGKSKGHPGLKDFNSKIKSSQSLLSVHRNSNRLLIFLLTLLKKSSQIDIKLLTENDKIRSIQKRFNLY
ncbi:hypothetical protein T4D_15089 [Trichinella pseudospiralis]|uniref:Uncharacterized protein n=1 Tax=Trichinella pseudospiralis TaxID=6337 RepID=A0A0V1G0E2_TRIPS|nr:hypothetical protein T4D_15089 [Trichinella pseudospiralis]